MKQVANDAVCLAALGDVDSDVLFAVDDAIRHRLGAAVCVWAEMHTPLYAWNPVRAQYEAGLILEHLAAEVPRSVAHVLAVIDADVFSPVFRFIYGSAQLRGRAAVLGLARLRQEHYGLAPDAALLNARARKEALHELGHTFGLVHCGEPWCVMSSSSNVGHVDRKLDAWCAGCVRQVTPAGIGFSAIRVTA